MSKRCGKKLMRQAERAMSLWKELSEDESQSIQGGTEFGIIAVAETSESSLVRPIPTIARKTQPLI